MRLVFEQEKREEKKIFEAMDYSECVVEYEDNEGDIEKILIVRDDDYENLTIFWRLSVYVYSIYNGVSIQEVYNQIENDFLMRRIIDVYPVLSTVTFERVKK